jgi:hypothetical protein
MDTSVSVELFVEILNRYVYYFDQQNETVSQTGAAMASLSVADRTILGHHQVLEWAY